MRYLLMALLFVSCSKQIVTKPAPVTNPTQIHPAYYINANGNIVNSGSSSFLAWNLEKANSYNFQPGDTLVLADNIQGTLRLTESGTHEAMIVIRGGRISSGDKDGIVLYNNDNILLTDISLQGSGNFAGGQNNTGIVLQLDDRKRHGNIVLNNITAKGYAYAGIRSFIHMSPEFSWESVEAAIAYPGGYDSVLVQHCVADSNGYAGIDMAGLWPGRQNKDILIANSSASHNRGIRGMKPHSGHGIILANTFGGNIDSCMATNNGWEFGIGNVGIWAFSAENVIIQNSVSFKNKSTNGIDGDGFDLDGGTWNCTMQNNLSYENDGAGFLIYEYGDPLGMKNNTCRYNISKNDARKGAQYGGITIGGAAALYDIGIFNNTIVSDKGKAITRIGNEVSGTLAIKNNILSTPESPYLYKDAENNFTGNALLDNKFTPQSNSPVVNKGLNIIGLPERDFYYNQIKDIRDIGAVEF